MVQALGGIAAHAEVEDALAQRVAHDNPKNYQLWNHRRRCALARGPEHAEQVRLFGTTALPPALWSLWQGPCVCLPACQRASQPEGEGIIASWEFHACQTPRLLGAELCFGTKASWLLRES
jgi:hypothetical protein